MKKEIKKAIETGIGRKVAKVLDYTENSNIIVTRVKDNEGLINILTIRKDGYKIVQHDIRYK